MTFLKRDVSTCLGLPENSNRLKKIVFTIIQMFSARFDLNDDLSSRVQSEFIIFLNYIIQLMELYRRNHYLNIYNL